MLLKGENRNWKGSNYNELQQDIHKNVKENVNIIKGRRQEQQNTDLFFFFFPSALRMQLNLYDHQFKTTIIVMGEYT